MKNSIVRSSVIPIFIVLFLFSGGSAAGANETPSDGGLYTVSLRIERSQPVVGNNTVTLTICDSRSNVGIEGAAIEVIPWMTMHGHGSSKKTTVKERGGGIYTVENVYFTMEGDWDLLINIQKNSAKDTVTLPVKKVKK